MVSKLLRDQEVLGQIHDKALILSSLSYRSIATTPR